ncbi:MAG: signal peptidase I [Clostridium sp.]|nr:signal peptidase I [Clostridium sp.]CCZ17907.1 signal peptidase [Clostridium sp. CAG:780]
MKYDIDDIQKRKELHARIRKLVYIFLVIILYNIVLLYMSYIDKFDTPSFYIYKAYVITTNSMEPELKKDDVVVIKKAKADNLKQGDIITFKQNGETITHRIVQIDDIEDGKLYITKGDNNNVQDEQGLRFDQIEGKLVIKIPQLGKMVASFKNGIIIVLVLLISAIIYLNRITAKERSNIRRAKKKLEDNKYINENNK